jgi:small multidrug resistance pump
VLLSYYTALAGAIILGVVGQLLLKSGALRSDDVADQILNPLTITGFAVYAPAALLYLICLRKLPLSVAYPSIAVGYIAVALASHLLWHEPLGWTRIAGTALIVSGVWILNHRL